MNEATNERSHLLLLVAFSFFIGCLSLTWFQVNETFWILAGIGAVLIALAKLTDRHTAAGIFLLVFALGALYANHAMHPAVPSTGYAQVEGTVYGGPKNQKEDAVSFVLSDVSINQTPVKGLAYCTHHFQEGNAPELFDGARIVLNGNVYLPSASAGNAHRDFRLWMYQRKYAFGVSSYYKLNILNDAATAEVADLSYHIREAIRERFRSVMGDECRVPMALLLGERDGLDETEYNSFQSLGIAHIMSISGLHAALLGGILLWFLGKLHVPKVPSLLLLALFLTGYCILTGNSPASVRASIMLLLACIARNHGRSGGNALTILAGGVIAVLLVDPLNAYSAGFVLSISAMLGILLFSISFRLALDHISPTPRIRSQNNHPILVRLASFHQNTKATVAYVLSAQIGILLPTAYYFHQIPLYGVMLNLLLVPLITGFLIPLYLMVLPASIIPYAGTLLGRFASSLTDLMLTLIKALSKLPNAVIRVASPSFIFCICAGAALAVLSNRIPGSFRRRCLASILCLLVGIGGEYLQRPAELRYIQLSAGVADSALLLDGSATVVIDTGKNSLEVLDVILKEGRDIDALILTHLHGDHAGGLENIRTSDVSIGHIYLPVQAREMCDNAQILNELEILESMGIPITELASGDELRYNKAVIHVLWPERGKVRNGQDANHYPLALLIDLDGLRLLQMSDLLARYESYVAFPADVLKVAHHGGNDATSNDFLNVVSPQYAIISTSPNSSRMPADETLARLEAHGVSVFRTDESGDITISVQDGHMTLIPFLTKEVP